MRIVIKTTYKNIDQEWLNWYIERLDKAGVPINFDEFKNGNRVSFTSKDPTSKAFATTEYLLIDEE